MSMSNLHMSMHMPNRKIEHWMLETSEIDNHNICDQCGWDKLKVSIPINQISIRWAQLGWALCHNLTSNVQPINCNPMLTPFFHSNIDFKIFSILLRVILPIGFDQRMQLEAPKYPDEIFEMGWILKIPFLGVPVLYNNHGIETPFL